jgi:hypothetical protein
LLCQPTTTKLEKINIEIDSRSFYEIKTSQIEIMMKMSKEKFDALKKKGQAHSMKGTQPGPWVNLFGVRPNKSPHVNFGMCQQQKHNVKTN